MKKFLTILLCLALVGCATASKDKKVNLDKSKGLGSAGQIVQLQGSLAQKEEIITRLQGLVIEKDRQITEKDMKIKEMRERLEMFGVFEK